MEQIEALGSEMCCLSAGVTFRVNELTTKLTNQESPMTDHTPDDDNDAVKDVVGVPQVLEEAEGRQFQDHLQGEHASEDNVTDLQHVGQLLGLRGEGASRQETKIAN